MRLLLALLLAFPLAADAACPPGAAPSPDGKGCYRERKVVWPTAEPTPTPAPGFIPVSTPKPVPDSVTGWIYKTPRPKPERYGELSTSVLIHRAGLGSPGITLDNLGFFFLVSSNGFFHNLEVHPTYFQDNPAAFNVFDWSCSPLDCCISVTHPQEGPKCSPQFVFVIDNAFTAGRPLEDYVFPLVDAGGHPHEAVRYRNRTEILAGDSTLHSPTLTATPPPIPTERPSPSPRFRNRAFLWHPTDQTWDVLYEHEFTHPFKHAGVGTWGPVLEVKSIDDGLPYGNVKEVGFENPVWSYDGKQIPFVDDGPFTFFEDVLEWPLLHRDPTGGFAAGVIVGEPVPCHGVVVGGVCQPAP